MITNAKDIPITSNNVALPNMSETLSGWFTTITFIRLTKTTVNHQTVIVEIPDSFIGVVQNLNARQLEMKPEGQRAWSWKMIHCLPSLILKPDEIIKYDSVNYRVMQQADWKEYGYIEYQLVRDYQ